MYGGVAGESGRPLPLCRFSLPMAKEKPQRAVKGHPTAQTTASNSQLVCSRILRPRSWQANESRGVGAISKGWLAKNPDSTHNLRIDRPVHETILNPSLTRL